MMSSLTIYTTPQGTQAVSNGTEHKFLPRAYSPWVHQAMLDWGRHGLASQHSLLLFWLGGVALTCALED